MFKHLMVFGLALTLPLVGLSAITTIYYASAEEARLEGQTQVILDKIAASVDREFKPNHDAACACNVTRP